VRCQINSRTETRSHVKGKRKHLQSTDRKQEEQVVPLTQPCVGDASYP